MKTKEQQNGKDKTSNFFFFQMVPVKFTKLVKQILQYLRSLQKKKFYADGQFRYCFLFTNTLRKLSLNIILTLNFITSSYIY